MAVACFTYGWGRWCARLFLGACPVGAWEQWRWRILCAGSVGLLLRRRILVEVRTLLCGAYSGCGWAPPYLCVWSGHLAAGRFLCTAPGPVAVSVFCVCLGSLWGVFCVLLWAVPGYCWADNSVGVGVCCVRRFLRTAGAQWRGLFWVQLGAVAGVFCVLSGLRACCGARVLWVSGLLGGASFARRSGPISGHGWGRWCAWLSVERVFGGCLGVVVLACSVRGFGFILFVMRWIIPLCLILTAFFPPSPERAETLRRNLLFEGTMLMR